MPSWRAAKRATHDPPPLPFLRRPHLPLASHANPLGPYVWSEVMSLQDMPKLQRQALINAQLALYALWATSEPDSAAQYDALKALDDISRIPKEVGP